MENFITKSKNIINKINIKLQVTYCIPVYNEINRFKTKEQHPNGEDFLNKKLDQCSQLFNNNRNISFNFIIIDDGCPKKSGKIINKYILNHNILNCEVIYLSDAINKNIFQNLVNINQSKKGGSVYYGMYHAIQTNYNCKHIIIYTDADLSTDLRQSGLLIDKLINGYDSAIGCRRMSESIMIKKGTRNQRGKIHAYYWKKLFDSINYITDTQTGFKGFNSTIIPNLIKNINIFNFCFDLEILLKCNQNR